MFKSKLHFTFDPFLTFNKNITELYIMRDNKVTCNQLISHSTVQLSYSSRQEYKAT